MGDNIDLDILSIYGNIPFDAMGMIKVVPHDKLVTEEFPLGKTHA